VVSDVKVTGRPAQFGRGMISEVGDRLLAEFAANLAAELVPAKSTQETAGAAATTEATRDTDAAAATPEPARPAEREAINLMDVAGASVAKRVVPIVAIAVAVIAIIVIARACGKG